MKKIWHCLLLILVISATGGCRNRIMIQGGGIPPSPNIQGRSIRAFVSYDPRLANIPEDKTSSVIILYMPPNDHLDDVEHTLRVQSISWGSISAIYCVKTEGYYVVVRAWGSAGDNVRVNINSVGKKIKRIAVVDAVSFYCDFNYKELIERKEPVKGNPKLVLSSVSRIGSSLRKFERVYKDSPWEEHRYDLAGAMYAIYGQRQ